MDEPWITSSDAWSWANLRSTKPFASRLDLLSWAVDEMDPRHHVFEFGVYLGTSISHIRDRYRARGGLGSVVGLDSFYGLPESWTDVGGRVSAGHFSTGGKPPEVDGVLFVIGKYADTLPQLGAMLSGTIGLAHVDCDLYSSTKDVLAFLTPRVVPGTIVVFDEMLRYPGWAEHEFKALQEWGVQTEFVAYDSGGGQQVAVRVK